MTVTTPALPDVLTESDRRSIHLAVAQWLRSARATSRARESLAALGIDRGEIERRRRAQSADPATAELLRLGVTLVMARGRLAESDLRGGIAHPTDQRLRAIATAAAEAFSLVAIAESVDRTAAFAPIDMEIGDY